MNGPSERLDDPEDVGVRWVVSTAPPGIAHDLARTLVSERLAACVNLLPGVRSVYRWKDGLQDEPETVLWVKTTPERLVALEERLRALHPYEVPELVVFAPAGGSRDYLAWVRESCQEVEKESPRGPEAERGGAGRGAPTRRTGP